MKKLLFPLLLCLITGTAQAQYSKYQAQVEALLAKMTLEEKVGQVIQADISAVTPAVAMATITVSTRMLVVLHPPRYFLICPNLGFLMVN